MVRNNEEDGSRLASKKEVDSEDEELEAIAHSAVTAAAGSAHKPVAPVPQTASAAAALILLAAASNGAPSADVIVPKHADCGPGTRVGGCGHGGRGGRGRGSGRFLTGQDCWPTGRSNDSASDIEHMLESIHQNLHISGAEWDFVTGRHGRFHL